MSGFLKPMEISVSGMQAQKEKMEIIAANVANSDTVMTKEGSFYKRQTPVFESIVDDEGKNSGVQVKEIMQEASNGVLKYEPNNPYADQKGFVKYPEINTVREMTDLISAQRAYEANIAVASSVKNMLSKTLDI
ncbi:MAG: flagellar basal body rod protein FlgC [Candidatus Goldiibacteriota bacterium]|jgi:flagellar basal-body rod protein FlgC